MKKTASTASPSDGERWELAGAVNKVPVTRNTVERLVFNRVQLIQSIHVQPLEVMCGMIQFKMLNDGTVQN